MPAGRPTDYRPEYCESVIKWGMQGKSLTWMAAELGQSKQTLHNWMAAHPEFFDAITRARAQSQKWWEDAGQNAMLMPGFNASVWAKSMAARFPEDWREKNETTVQGPNGGPVQVTKIEIVPGVVSKDKPTA
jgi:hypothetical protein